MEVVEVVADEAGEVTPDTVVEEKEEAEVKAELEEVAVVTAVSPSVFGLVVVEAEEPTVEEALLNGVDGEIVVPELVAVDGEVTEEVVELVQ